MKKLSKALTKSFEESKELWDECKMPKDGPFGGGGIYYKLALHLVYALEKVQALHKLSPKVYRLVTNALIDGAKIFEGEE